MTTRCRMYIGCVEFSSRSAMRELRRSLEKRSHRAIQLNWLFSSRPDDSAVKIPCGSKLQHSEGSVLVPTWLCGSRPVRAENFSMCVWEEELPFGLRKRARHLLR